MIDEKKLIKELTGLTTSNEMMGYLTAFDVVQDCIGIVENQPKTDWIPCEERLPEESLNSVIGWDEYRERCVFVQYLGGRFVLGNDIDSVKITAWQPLPAPYKKEGAE